MEDKDKIIKKFHSDPLHFFGFYFAIVILFVLGIFLFKPLIFVSIFVVILIEISRRCENFYIMDYGVGREYRLLSTSRKFIGYDKIQNIEVRQSFIENVFGIGTIKFDTAGMDKVELHFNGVASPHKIEEIIREKMISK